MSYFTNLSYFLNFAYLLLVGSAEKKGALDSQMSTVAHPTPDYDPMKNLRPDRLTEHLSKVGGITNLSDAVESATSGGDLEEVKNILGTCVKILLDASPTDAEEPSEDSVDDIFRIHETALCTSAEAGHASILRYILQNLALLSGEKKRHVSKETQLYVELCRLKLALTFSREHDDILEYILNLLKLKREELEAEASIIYDSEQEIKAYLQFVREYLVYKIPNLTKNRSKKSLNIGREDYEYNDHEGRWERRSPFLSLVSEISVGLLVEAVGVHGTKTTVFDEVFNILNEDLGMNYLNYQEIINRCLLRSVEDVSRTGNECAENIAIWINEGNASINTQDGGGYTPLMKVFLREGKADKFFLTKWLILEGKADMFIRNYTGKTAMEVALQRAMNMEMLKFKTKHALPENEDLWSAFYFLRQKMDELADEKWRRWQIGSRPGSNKTDDIKYNSGARASTVSINSLSDTESSGYASFTVDLETNHGLYSTLERPVTENKKWFHSLFGIPFFFVILVGFFVLTLFLGLCM